MFGLVPFGARKNLAKSDERPQSIWDVFDEPFFQDDFFPAMGGWNQSMGMRVDVKDNGNHYELTADLPGMAKEDINLSYQNSYLTISAQKNESKDEKDEAGNYIRRERRSGSMSRSFYIDNIDQSKVTAEFKDGVLHVNMPKAAEVQHVSQIEIK